MASTSRDSRPRLSRAQVDRAFGSRSQARRALRALRERLRRTLA